jgi:hypothetical protein
MYLKYTFFPKEVFLKFISIVSIALMVIELSPLPVARAEEKEEVIVVSILVGEEIDREERERYELFPQFEGFTSAVFLKLHDGSYVVEVTYIEEGEEKIERIIQTKTAIESLKYYIENYDILKPRLSEIEIKEKEVVRKVKTPFNSKRALGEVMGGIGGGALLGLVGGGIGYSLFKVEDPQDFESLAGFIGATLGFAIGYPIGSAIGVYAVGNMGNETGSFMATFGGSLLGTGLGIGTFPLRIGYLSFLFPPLGSMITFNMTRRYKVPPPETGFINYRNGSVSFGPPSVYYTQKSEFGKKTLTQNITLLNINF